MSGAALNICLEVHQAFEVLNTPPEQRVSILASTVFCAETPHGVVVKQAISAAIRKYKDGLPRPIDVAYELSGAAPCIKVSHCDGSL